MRFCHKLHWRDNTNAEDIFPFLFEKNYIIFVSSLLSGHLLFETGRWAQNIQLSVINLRTGSDTEDKVASSISPQTPSSQNNFCIFQSSVSYLNISNNSKVEYILSRRLSGLVKFRYDPAFSFKGGSFWFDGATLLCGFLFGFFFLQILTFCHLYSFYLQRSEL